MRVADGGLLYSASDLVSFIGYRHSVLLDLRHLDEPMAPAEDDEQARLLQDKGPEHERAYPHRLRDAGLREVEVPDGPFLAEGHAAPHWCRTPRGTHE